MNDSGIYIGAVLELKTGFEIVESCWYKTCPKCKDAKIVSGNFCSACGTELVCRTIKRQRDYQQYLSDEDMFYELPVSEANEKGISYLVSNLRSVKSELDTSSPVSLIDLDMRNARHEFAQYYQDQLKRLSENGFEWEVKYMALEWAEY